MILGAAFCPQPPLLVPALSGSAAADVADLLAGCDAAIAAATAHADRILVLGGGVGTAEFPTAARDSLDRFGGRSPDGARRSAGELPLPLSIAAWLLERHRPGLADVRLLAVAHDLDRPDADPTADAVGAARTIIDGARTALLVMGDGSARRGPKAPGYLDDHAAGFDAGVRAAIATGDAGRLADLDPAVAHRLLAAGVPAWRVAGNLLAPIAWAAEIHYEGDPFGVYYLAAAWTPART